MAIDERVETLEDEFKLIKGELKQTLVNVRDFLLDLNLPALQEEGPTPEIHEHDEHHEPEAGAQDSDRGLLPPPPPQAGAPTPEPPTYHGGEQGIPSVSQVTSIGAPPPQAMPFEITAPPQAMPFEITAPPEAMPFEITAPPEAMPFESTAPPEAAETAEQDQEVPLQDIPPFQEEETWLPPEASEQSGQLAEELRQPSEGEPEQNEEIKVKVSQRDSQVNLLANLIRWVSAAKREIGNGQLPAFLDVYSIGGHLSPEVREVILHLAETIAPKSARVKADTALSVEANEDMAPPTEANADTASSVDANTDMAPSPSSGADADVWSRLILELHGILSRGGSPFHPLKLSWNGHEQNEALQNKAEGETEDSLINPQSPVAAKGGKLENKLPKKGKTKAKGRRSEDKSSPPKENKPARLKLVIPFDDDGEKEFSIGEFSINLTPEGE